MATAAVLPYFVNFLISQLNYLGFYQAAQCVLIVLWEPSFKKTVLRKMLLKWSTLGLCTCCPLYLECPVLRSPHIIPLPDPLSVLECLLFTEHPFLPAQCPHSPLVASHHTINTIMYTITLCCKHLFPWISSLYSVSFLSFRTCTFKIISTPYPPRQRIRQKGKP